MLVQPFTTDFSNIGEQLFLRCDPKYRYFWDRRHGQVLLCQKSVPLKQVLHLLPKKVIRKGVLSEVYKLLGIDNSEPRDGQLRNLPAKSEVASDKLLLKHADLIIGKLGMTRGYIFDNTLKGQNLIGSTELIPYQLTSPSYSAKYLKYLLLLPAYLSAYAYLESGKTPSHWRVNPLDFLRIKIPVVAQETQSFLLERVAPVQARINQLIDASISGLDITNHVFAREFGYNLEEYGKLAAQHTYQKAFSDFAKSFQVRSSVKFQHPKYEYVDRILSRYQWVKLKTLIKQGCKIHKGVVPEYSEDGEVMVLKTINLKHGSIDYEVCDFVSQEFWQTNKQAHVSRGDILVSCHGEGRGKFDIYDKNYPAIIDINTAVVPIDPDRINPLYCTYFMQSLLGKLQFELLESETKAVRYMQPENLKEMRIINLDPKKQDAIVKEVRAQLQEIQKQKIEVDRLRDEIDKLLIQALSTT